MGCDGGTIPRRDELVAVRKRPEQKDKHAQMVFEWNYCALSQMKLELPIVLCKFGKLYNKTAILQSLIDKTAPKHIRNLKDVKQLQLKQNCEFNANNNGICQFVCPLTGLEMSGKFPFVCLWNCGCVFAQRALREITADGQQCPNCLGIFEKFQWITLNSNESHVIKKKRISEEKKGGKKQK